MSVMLTEPLITTVSQNKLDYLNQELTGTNSRWTQTTNLSLLEEQCLENRI